MGTPLRFLIGSLVLGSCLQSASNAAQTVDFASQVAPLLQQHCIRCHSQNNRQGEISLATRDNLAEHELVDPGDPDASYLLELVRPSADDRPRMPAEGKPLTKAQVRLLRDWIEQGAPWPEAFVVREQPRADGSWWSLQPLRDPTPPAVLAGTDKAANPIDLFIAAELDAAGLAANGPADRRTLVRRATYDLTGLPPTPEEVRAFVADRDPNAFAKLVDRLLESPHYGERWGRHWLDVVRFGESNGFERNVLINDLWPFRDYVIRSLNEDKPFDDFMREHLAGDVLDPDDPSVVVGSAFLVAGPYDDVRNRDPVQAAQIRANTIDEMIRTASEAFLGLTIGCARCHDHKFDPILQRDYYAWYATFAGVRHGSRPLATPQEIAAHQGRLAPLEHRRDELQQSREALLQYVRERAQQQGDRFQRQWVRPAPDRRGTEETFAPVEAKWVRLRSLGRDTNPNDRQRFNIDEFEVWSAGPGPRNVALESAGAKASGPSREIEDFPGAYAARLAIDGKVGERFIGVGGHLTIELAEPTVVDRVVFSSARGEDRPEQPKFAFVAEYRIEVSIDGADWREVASSADRKPVSQAHRENRLEQLVITPDEQQQLDELRQELALVQQQIDQVPELPTAWIGERVEEEAAGPFYVFLGGSPQRKGDQVLPSSLAALSSGAAYELSAAAAESERRRQLADWLVHPENPLTPRVLANRLWHYHFGTGLVATPSDFGFMGSAPSHPELLDWLATQVVQHGWRLKPLHKLIMSSQAYQRSSVFRADAAKHDGDARLLWRFPPRRLSAEELRDTMLAVAGVLDRRMGGPGFRLYHFMQDNVSTYVPLDEHGPESYRRAVYHQNARAAVVDLMTEFDQPDCAFTTPRRAETTTPLQALTMLNHNFTLAMAEAMAERIRAEVGHRQADQVERAFELCFLRGPTEVERSDCRRLVEEFGLKALCRGLLNTSELIYVQ